MPKQHHHGFVMRIMRRLPDAPACGVNLFILALEQELQKIVKERGQNSKSLLSSFQQSQGAAKKVSHRPPDSTRNAVLHHPQRP